MTGATLLLRQIHPNWVQAGFVTSQAFRPTQKDEWKLSVSDGDRITPEASWVHHTTVRGLASVGVMAVTVEECSAEDLPSRPDPLPDCPEHSIVDFTDFTAGQREKKAKKLKKVADDRGWLYQVPAIA